MRTARIAAIVALGLAACVGGDGSYDYANSKGAALYPQMCEACHGEIGEGGFGPKLLDTRKSQDDLRRAIAIDLRRVRRLPISGEIALCRHDQPEASPVSCRSQDAARLH